MFKKTYFILLSIVLIDINITLYIWVGIESLDFSIICHKRDILVIG